MRKFIALGMVAGMMMPTMVFARGNHPMAGCGLGYLLISNKDNDKVTQVIGATTNGTFGSQTFGISSGTSGCTEDGAVKVAKETEVYAEVNFDSLKREMATGQGEFVNTFASMLGASDAERPTMVQFFQKNYSALFPSAQTSSAELLANLKTQLAEHPELLS